MDRFPPAKTTPQSEMQSVGRTMEDLAAAQKASSRPGGILKPLLFVAATIVVLLAFLDWLVVH